MSITSRQRNAKRRTRNSSPLFPGPDMGLIPTKALRLFRPDKGDAHNYQPHGKHGATVFASDLAAARRLKKAKARESKLV